VVPQVLAGLSIPESKRATYDNGTRTEEAGILARTDFYQRAAVPFDGQPFPGRTSNGKDGFQTFVTAQSRCATNDTAMKRRLTRKAFLSAAVPVCGFSRRSVRRGAPNRRLDAVATRDEIRD